MGVLVRVREAEFWGPGAARKPFRTMHCKMLLAALTGWQMGMVVVCGTRAFLLCTDLGRDPVVANAAGPAHAGRPGVQRVSAAAVASQSRRASDASMPFLPSGLFLHGTENKT